LYLKRLDLQGFKSFANKTTLEFAPGVTCVVGPNGTGKTNVADSIRWVLGEHARSAIRARRTEDVIFAGSDKRAPLGVAEVHITLDNEQGWLPIDFSEVVVTRRAYRNGENEYLINHSKVRLRDVVELFQRAQVGQNSYAFMGQGMVEQALSLRPEDRRALIEEAADVRVYRNKLEDARNKLKATRENVERVGLLVREIGPRISQLERQAGRAVRHQELTRELAATLHVWYAHQWQEVNEQLLAAITTEDQCTSDAQQARADAKVCEDALGQLRAAIDERRREITARDAALRSMQDYVRDLERRAALDAERTKMLTERIEELVQELAMLRAEHAAQEQETPLPDTTELEKRLAETRDELAQQRARLASVEQEMHELQRDALANEQAAARARAIADDYTRRLSDAEGEIARIRQEDAASSGGRGQIIAELKAWAQEYTRALADSVAAQGALEQARVARERAAANEAHAREEQRRLEDELRSIRNELEAAQIKLDLYETIEVQPHAPDAGVRLILEAGGVIKRETVPADVELSGVRGLIGQLIRVPNGLEKAIEAALAENLFAIVFDRDGDLRAAVNLLLDGDSGRATLYALDSFHESRPLHLIKERAVVGVASALVRCDSRYRALVDTLLGRTVVVEDLATAQKFVRRGLAHAVATRDGVLLRPIGSVSAGTPAIITAAMAHGREVGDLPAEIERLRPAIAQSESALAEAVRRQGDVQQRVTEFDAQIEELRQRKMRADSALAGARGDLAAFTARLRAHAAENERRVEEVARLEGLLQRYVAERDTRTREALAAEDKEQHARRGIDDLESVRAQLSDVIAEHAATVAHLDGELRTDRQATGGERASREWLQRQITAKDEQRERLLAEARAIAARAESDGRELAAKQGEAKALQQELEPARRELAQFESRERTLSQELMEANGRLRESERALLDAENDVRIRNEELDSLRVSLESEGFVALEDGEVQRVPEPEPTQSSENGDAPSNGDLPTWLRSEDDDAVPPIRGGSTINPTEVRDRIADLRAQIRALGPVNEQAATDFTESRERYDFLTTQLKDLQEAETQLLDAVDDLEREIRERFRATFKVVNQEFERYFNAFFRGGTARLELGENDDEGLPGVEIYAQPPGKKLGSLALLSGGERSLTAVALLFALLQANPSPICVLDEVDAALDEANVGRFVDELRALSEKTQFVIITHNRRTIETADTIYGVSMGADSVSRVLSLKLSDVPHAE
jgi:chromosome segregation protein